MVNSTPEEMTQCRDDEGDERMNKVYGCVSATMAASWSG